MVDPSLHPDVYIQLASERGWTIRHVLDTHIHADHLSRSRLLSELTGARLQLPARQRVVFPHESLVEGTAIRFGQATLRALQTPGHTLESMSYLVDKRWLFTGDTLFLAAVGRPDLEASPEQARDRALLLHASLQRLFKLDPGLLVLPAHTSHPVAFDQSVVTASLATVRDAGQVPDSAVAFADRVLSRIPATPPHHHAIVGFNEAGEMPAGDPTDLEAGANRCAVS